MSSLSIAAFETKASSRGKGAVGCASGSMGGIAPVENRVVELASGAGPWGEKRWGRRMGRTGRLREATAAMVMLQGRDRTAVAQACSGLGTGSGRCHRPWRVEAEGTAAGVGGAT